MSARPGGRRGLVLLTVVVLVVAATATVTGAFASVQQPAGDEVLDRVEQQYESAETLSSTATVTVENDTWSATATVELAATDDNRSRVIVTRDGTTYRAGTNGTVAWAVTPNRSAAWPVEGLERDAAGAVPGQSGPRAGIPGDGARHLQSQGRPVLNDSTVSATVVGTPTVDGTSTYEVELTHTEVTGSTTLWVTQDDYRVVRAVATDGTNRTEVDVQSTAFNVSIHESTFDPPTDRLSLSTIDSYDEFGAAQSATELTLPRLDATFAEATVLTRQGETIVGQRYVRDGETVRVVSTTAGDRFEAMTANATTTEIDGQTVAIGTAEDLAVAVWTDEGVTTAVLVEGSTDRAVAVADDL